MLNNLGKLVVITGFPASGQDTMMNLLLERKSNFSRIITHTDRPKRPNEVQDIDYHFVTTERFKQMISKDLFFEYVLHGSYYKGTVKQEFKPVLTGRNIVWRIDAIRASLLEETMYERFNKKTAQLILSKTYKFILKTETKETALSRYKKRDPHSKESEFNKRYRLVEDIFNNNPDKFPHVIINKTDHQNYAIGQIEKILATD